MIPLFRSDEMSYYSLAMPRENAWDILNSLGEISCLQFVDQQPNVAIYTRPYSNFIRRCEEINIKIDFIEEQIKLFGNTVKRCQDIPEFLKSLRNFVSSRGKAERTYFEELEHELAERHEYLTGQIEYFNDITSKKNRLLEYRSVLTQASQHLVRAHIYAGEDKSSFKLHYLSGLISKEDENRFKRMVFRVSKGNAFMICEERKTQNNDYEEELIDPKSVELEIKVFHLKKNS